MCAEPCVERAIRIRFQRAYGQCLRVARNKPIGSGSDEATTDTTILPARSDVQTRDLSGVRGCNGPIAKYFRRVATGENECDNPIGIGVRNQQNLIARIKRAGVKGALPVRDTRGDWQFRQALFRNTPFKRGATGSDNDLTQTLTILSTGTTYLHGGAA